MSLVVVLARIGDQRVAFDAREVESVVDLGWIAPVPLAPPHVAGLTALGSRVVTVIDCALLLHLTSAHADRAITASCGGHSYALRVDAVSDACEVDDPVPLDTAAAGPAWASVADGVVRAPEGYALLIHPARLLGESSQDVA